MTVILVQEGQINKICYEYVKWLRTGFDGVLWVPSLEMWCRVCGSVSVLFVWNSYLPV